MDNYMIGVIVLLISVFISRLISENAIKKLDQDKKAALVDVFSKDRIWNFGFLIGLIVIFFISLKFNLLDPFWAFLSYIIISLIYIVLNTYKSYKRLKENDFPDSFNKSYLISSSLRLAGFLIFLAFMQIKLSAS